MKISNAPSSLGRTKTTVEAGIGIAGCAIILGNLSLIAVRLQLYEVIARTAKAGLQAWRWLADMNMRSSGGAGNGAAECDKGNPGLT
jgi:hypothetical protein